MSASNTNKNDSGRVFSNSLFHNSWEEIENIFSLMKGADIFPIQLMDGSSITQESLRNSLETHKTGKFTIAVCGQVKSGKSTLLNSLLFGDSVLPVFDTPFTAKLTHIEYKEGPAGFTVNFYSKEEWETLLDELSEESRKELDARLEFCSFYLGVHKRDWIGHPSIHLSSLEMLSQYLSVPRSTDSNSGRFTPFVRDVHIHVPYENLRDVVIVDTPGLNDSNAINSLETTRWIQNAHAVVYVLPLEGVTGADVEFFKQYFPSTAEASRIFVQNKIDGDENYMSVRQAMKEYGTQDRFRKLKLFGPSECICSYSGLLALIKSKQGRGISPDEDEQYYLDQVASDFNPDPDNLAATLEETLFKNEGRIRIDRAKGELVRALEAKIRVLNRELEEYEAYLKDCDLTADELEEKISSVCRFKKDFSDLRSGWKSEDKRKRHVSNISFEERNNNFCKECKRKTNKKIDAMDRQELRLLLVDKIRSICKDEFIVLKKFIYNLENETEDRLAVRKEDLCDKAKQYEIDDEININSIIDDGEMHLGNTFYEAITTLQNDINERIPGFFAGIFWLTSKMQVRAISSANDFFIVIEDNNKKYFNNLLERIKNLQEQPLAYINDWIIRRESILENLKQEKSDTKQMKILYQNKVSEIKKEIKEKTALKDSIAS